jgi:hypothetical protein
MLAPTSAGINLTLFCQLGRNGYDHLQVKVVSACLDVEQGLKKRMRKGDVYLVGTN